MRSGNRINELSLLDTLTAHKKKSFSQFTKQLTILKRIDERPLRHTRKMKLPSSSLGMLFASSPLFSLMMASNTVAVAADPEQAAATTVKATTSSSNSSNLRGLAAANGGGASTDFTGEAEAASNADVGIANKNNIENIGNKPRRLATITSSDYGDDFWESVWLASEVIEDSYYMEEASVSYGNDVIGFDTSKYYVYDNGYDTGIIAVKDNRIYVAFRGTDLSNDVLNSDDHYDRDIAQLKNTNVERIGKYGCMLHQGFVYATQDLLDTVSINVNGDTMTFYDRIVDLHTTTILN